MRKLLVTGGAGFIGSNFVHYWLKRYPSDRVVVLDALTYAGNLMSLADARNLREFRFVHGNICNTSLVEDLLRQEGLDTLVHFAAESHVDRSISGPDAFIETNVVGTHSLLKAARKVWLGEAKVPTHRFHHVSTDEVYGSLRANDPPFTESTSYAPNSPYSASKAASDHMVRAYHHTYGLNTTISNCSNNYGPYHLPEKLIPLVIVNILDGKDLPVYGDGQNVRDWLHVGDHCRGIELVLNDASVGGVYNLGGRSECDNVSIVRSLCQLADQAFLDDPSLGARFPQAPPAHNRMSETLIKFVRDRPGHDRRYAVDCSKAESELGFRPAVTLADGLLRTLQWYLDNERWWRPFTGGTHRQVSATGQV